MDNENNFKKTFKNILRMVGSNISIILSGIFVSFLLPKVIGVGNYGYYKTFTLYASYIGLFNLGFIDGIILKYSGKNYEDLDKKQFRFYTKFIFTLEFLFSLITLLIALFALNGEYKFIFICLSFYLFSHNLSNYYQFVAQATSQFKMVASRNVIQSVFTIFSILVLFLYFILTNELQSYIIFTIIYVLIQAILLIWYIYNFKDITFGVSSNFKEQKQNITNLIINGIPLMFSMLISTLILNIDRQFVNILFTNEEYSIYAFAYNILALFTTAISSISTVIYTVIKGMDINKAIKNYSMINVYVLIMLGLFLSGFFPISIFIKWFLPQFKDSLSIFIIILPSILLTCPITIIMHNYYKTLNKNLKFFIISIFVLLISVVFNIVAITISHSMINISIASIVTILIWYIVSEICLFNKFDYHSLKKVIYILILIGSFYYVGFKCNEYVAFALYLLVYVIITFIFYRSNIIALIKKMKNRRLLDRN